MHRSVSMQKHSSRRRTLGNFGQYAVEPCESNRLARCQGSRPILCTPVDRQQGKAIGTFADQQVLFN